jgi:hypothetical protein
MMTFASTGSLLLGNKLGIRVRRADPRVCGARLAVLGGTSVWRTRKSKAGAGEEEAGALGAVGDGM